MRHQIRSQKFNRTSNERKLLIRSLITSLVVNERIITTKTKANLLKRNVDKMLTFARRKDGLTYKRLLEWLPNKDLAVKLEKEILPLISDRKSGYTSLTKMGFRKGDNTQMVIVEWMKKQETPIAAKEKNITKKPAGQKKGK